jgi:hypothetical protein
MMHVGRIHPPNKQVLRDISLGFHYGAKIGVPCLKGYGPQRGCQSDRGSNVSRVSSEPSGRMR